MAYTNSIPSAHLPDLFPGIQEAHPLTVSSFLFHMRPDQMPMLLPYEQLVMAALVRHLQPGLLLEFGTAAGQTTFALAANSPLNARVYTVDLITEEQDDYTRRCMLGQPQLGHCFIHSPDGDKVSLLLRKRGEALPSPIQTLAGRFGLIHVDGDHSYTGVKADTAEALAMSTPDGVIVWHDFYSMPDYVADPPEKRGVYPFLNQLQNRGELVLRHIIGTFLVVGSRRWLGCEPPGEIIQPGDIAPPFGTHNVRLAATVFADGG
jgi:predicted O-methyltransferase YrrM